jgi:SAM-dependent methyltransferase
LEVNSVVARSHSKAQLDAAKAQAFQMKFVHDLSAVAGIACANIGDRLGLYKIMAEHGALNSEQLAKLSGTHERYIREWLINQASGGYINYDPSSKLYDLPPEHAAVLADEDSMYFGAGALELFMSMLRSEPKVAECFSSGEGWSWCNHDPGVFSGTRRFFRPAYKWQLIPNWLPSVNGLVDRLNSGIKVADVGCGHGVSTIFMAKEFPRSRFNGFDNHADSIDSAREAAKKDSSLMNVLFDAAAAQSFPGEGYGLVTFFDCLHDMGDPVAACKRAAESLDEDGVVLIVEPMAGNAVEENFNPIGRILSGASVLCCTPNAMATGKHSLGTIATDAALAEVAREGGLKHFKRVCETPFNRVFEARRK